jgi:hypothetical protein
MIPLDKIYLFLADDPLEKEAYHTILQHSNYYHKIHIVYGPIGLCTMRNFITNYFDEDTPILSIDDDISMLYTLYEDLTIHNTQKAAHWKLIPMTSKYFHTWMDDVYDNMKNNNRNLFGIYPVKNGFFMKDLANVTFDPRFCVGAFWGVFNKKSIKISLEEKEDMERSILYTIHDTGVLRYNHVTLLTKYYKNVGGMQSTYTYTQREEKSYQSSQVLFDKYPELCTLYKSKKNGMCEIRFKRIPSKLQLV